MHFSEGILEVIDSRLGENTGGAILQAGREYWGCSTLD